jgi:hypothetical protein
MTLRYTSTNRVVESIKQICEEVDIGDDSVSLSVYDTDATLCNATLEDVRERNLVEYLGDELCSFTYDCGRLTLHFHENQVEGTFELTPAGVDAIDPQQATGPSALAPSLKSVLLEVSDELDVISYDFVEVSAASMATGGHFTDFEFEYVVTTTKV